MHVTHNEVKIKNFTVNFLQHILLFTMFQIKRPNYVCFTLRTLKIMLIKNEILFLLGKKDNKKNNIKARSDKSPAERRLHSGYDNILLYFHKQVFSSVSYCWISSCFYLTASVTYTEGTRMKSQLQSWQIITHQS